MTTQTINNLCVVGAGFMGTQIGLQAAVHGRRVAIHDVDEAALDRSVTEQSWMLDEQVGAGAVAGDQRAAIEARIRRTTSLAEAVTDVDLVIEAAKEDIAVKREIFGELDRVCPPHIILATNSSSIRISLIESTTKRLERVLNAHFVSHVWRHPFVELMSGTATSEDTLQAVREFMSSIGLLPIHVRQENTGFVFNCIWRAVKTTALRVVDQGVATVEDVDRTWMIAMETPFGPFAKMDRVGLDVVRDIEMVYYKESGDPSDAPPKLLLDKIDRGELGVKTAKGFYTYPNPSWQSPDFLKPSP